MSNTYYTSLSGMVAASYGLQNTSNNVANMQSPGFKRNDVFYSSLGNHGSQDGLGSGVYVGGQSTNFAAGQCTKTGNASDVAIDGNGFFIIRLKNNELLYTRAGEFAFNDEGLLADKHSGGLVQGYNARGALVPINQTGSAVSAGKATRSIDIKGEFVIHELEKDPTKSDAFLDSKYESIKFSLATVFDEQGKAHTIQFEFQSPHSPVNNTGDLENLHWTLISATCLDASVSFDVGQYIQFNDSSSGVAKEGHNQIQFTLNGSQPVTMNFGDYTKDRNSSVRLFKKDAIHINSEIDIKEQDGYSFGKPSDFSFDDNGLITYYYNNGQSETGHYIALAHFDDLKQSLTPAKDNLFRAKNERGRHIGRANQDNFGLIKPGNIESSNIDSTREFANIVVLQRMFQACSQIMDIDKQLLEELYKK